MIKGGSFRGTSSSIAQSLWYGKKVAADLTDRIHVTDRIRDQFRVFVGSSQDEPDQNLTSLFSSGEHRPVLQAPPTSGLLRESTPRTAQGKHAYAPNQLSAYSPRIWVALHHIIPLPIPTPVRLSTHISSHLRHSPPWLASTPMSMQTCPGPTGTTTVSTSPGESWRTTRWCARLVRTRLSHPWSAEDGCTDS